MGHSQGPGGKRQEPKADAKGPRGNEHNTREHFRGPDRPLETKVRISAPGPGRRKEEVRPEQG